MSNRPEKPDAEFTQLKERVRRLEQHILSHPEAKQFVEHRGVLFKRKAVGGYQEAVYCPKCGFVMSKINDTGFSCLNCNIMFDTSGHSLASVLHELPKNPPAQ